MESVIKVVIYMKDVQKDFSDMNSIYRQFFVKDQEQARVAVQALSPLDGIDIEIEVIAIIK